MNRSNNLKYEREIFSLQENLDCLTKDIDNLKIESDMIKPLDTKIVFKYLKQYDYFDFPNLPVEINNIIHSFNKSFINHSTIIKYKRNYPYSPPIWYFDYVETSYDKQLLENIYKNQIVFHNNELFHSWSSYISMEKDILYYLVNINDTFI